VPRGVAMGWTGVDMFTPLLPEVVPEIDTNPVSSYSRAGRLGSVIVWSLTRPSLPYVKFKETILEFAYGGFAPDSLTRGSAPGPHWGSAPKPRYRFTLRALAMRVHPTYFDLATPLNS